MMDFCVAQILFIHPLAVWPWIRSVSLTSVSSLVTGPLYCIAHKVSVSIKCMSSTQAVPGDAQSALLFFPPSPGLSIARCQPSAVIPTPAPRLSRRQCKTCEPSSLTTMMSFCFHNAAAAIRQLLIRLCRRSVCFVPLLPGELRSHAVVYDYTDKEKRRDHF